MIREILLLTIVNVAVDSSPVGVVLIEGTNHRWANAPVVISREHVTGNGHQDASHQYPHVYSGNHNDYNVNKRRQPAHANVGVRNANQHRNTQQSSTDIPLESTTNKITNTEATVAKAINKQTRQSNNNNTTHDQNRTANVDNKPTTKTFVSNENKATERGEGVPAKTCCHNTTTKKNNADVTDDDKWIWSSDNGNATQVTTQVTTPETVDVDNRVAIEIDKCPDGKLRINGTCDVCPEGQVAANQMCVDNLN